MEAKSVGLRIPFEHQGSGIVDEDGEGDASESLKGQGHPLPPIVLTFAEEGFDRNPPKIAEHGHEEVDPHRLSADPLTEIDLHLIAGRRRPSHRRTPPYEDHGEASSD